MAISRQKKEELVAEYVENLKKSHGFILTDFSGLSVNETSALRAEMRPLDGRLQIVKNRLLALALEEVDVSIPQEWLIGPTAVSFCFDELPPVAKVLKDATKDLEALQIKGGVMAASPLDVDEINVIADLPSREVLLSQVLGTINAPATQVAGVVASGVRQILNVLQAYVDKLEESGGGLEQAAEPA